MGVFQSMLPVKSSLDSKGSVYFLDLLTSVLKWRVLQGFFPIINITTGMISVTSKRLKDNIGPI